MREGVSDEQDIEGVALVYATEELAGLRVVDVEKDLQGRGGFEEHIVKVQGGVQVET